MCQNVSGFVWFCLVEMSSFVHQKSEILQILKGY